MKLRSFVVASLAFAAALAGCATLDPDANPETSGSPAASALRAGVASVPLNLPVATPLAGYGGLARRLLIADTGCSKDAGD